MRPANLAAMNPLSAIVGVHRGVVAGLISGLLSVGAARAQQAAPTDSTRPARPQPAPRGRIGFVISLDNRQSFVQASAVRIIGLNAGIVLPNRRWRVGLGGYTLSRDFAELYTTQATTGKRAPRTAPVGTVTPQLDLTYFTPNVSYVFVQRPWLEVSLPVEFGLGRSHYYETDGAGKTQYSTRGLFFPVEVGVNVLVKPWRWVGVSGSVGYRKSLFEIKYKEDFDGMYFSYRLNVFLGVIWRDWQAYRLQRRAASALPAK